MAKFTSLATSAGIYQNPVYGRDFPDPFVLKFCGEYWAYCTGFWPDGRCFGILHSTDLIHWREVGGALEPLPGNFPCYWAAEVSYDNGRFYMYYSVGNEDWMEIRVAVADQPAGPFVDSGHKLTSETFAIDPHVFVDEDGRRYLFYATDFLDYSQIGTGTVIAELRDPFTLAESPRPVTRALYDWQVYDPHRASKGGVRWHTIEGPFILKRKNLYYEMFSGGNWQNISYGVSYALSDRLDRPDEWRQVADGEKVLPILRTLPGQVIGPGHNSVVRGPDNRQLFCVYHRWASDGSGRQMAIDPLDWAGERMLILGPSTTPQPILGQPFLTTADFYEIGTTRQGQWSLVGPALRQSAPAGRNWMTYALLPVSSFLMELSLCGINPAGGRYGVGIAGLSPQPLLTVALEPPNRQLVIEGAGLTPQSISLDPAFRFDAYHLLRLEIDGQLAQVRLDEGGGSWQGRLAAEPAQWQFFTEETAANFGGLALTLGWEDLFMYEGSPAQSGWQGDLTGWQVTGQRLSRTESSSPATLSKGPLLRDYELVINAGLCGEGGSYGFYPAYSPTQPGPLLQLTPHASGWALTSPAQVWPLPAEFDPTQEQQFRFVKLADRLSVQWENQPLGALTVPPGPATVALWSDSPAARFDMVRVTALAGTGF